MLHKILLILTFFGILNAGIVNTKHNLSDSGVGTVKSASEKEICVFCHIPHGAQAGKPLWNRSMPTSNYTMYSSTYLERSNYPTPNDLGSSVDTPGNLSRQCLSCHDGTIAIGAIYALRGTVLGDKLTISNTNLDGTMQNTSSAFIGTDLSAHHPVGYEYGASMTFSDVNESTRGNELNATPTSPVKTYTYSGYSNSYVECSSCHDPHTENNKFLRVNGGSHAENIKNTCISCHNKDGWTGSAHDTNTTQYSAESGVPAEYGTFTTVAKMGCVNCHTPHNGEGQPYLLRKIEQNTCFQGAAGSPATASCHNSGGAKDIETPLNKFYGHGFRMLFTDGVHTNLDYAYGNGVARNPSGSKGITWDDSKHVECMDCHNQHQAKSGTHAASTSWYPTSGSNLISSSGPLTGASGVEPNYNTSRWKIPDSYTTLESATKEYQICFKCHSSWALDNTTTPFSSHNTISDSAKKFTDKAWEFSLRNRSAHPVTVSANDRVGSSTPRQLTTGQMTSPWTSVGTQTMFCSDCHGTDNENNGSTAKGPHGSSIKYMLKGAGTEWPINEGITTPIHFQVGESHSDANRRTAGLFCQNCHELDVDRSGGKSAPHNVKNEMNGLYCVRCHTAIPHGSPLSRLQATKNFPEPYNYGGNMNKQWSFQKSNSYSDTSTYFGSYTAPEAGSGNCNNKHRDDLTREVSPY